MKIRMLLLTLLIVLLLFYALGGFYASTQVIGEHPGWRKLTAQPADFGLKAQVVSFNSQDGTPLKAWCGHLRARARRADAYRCPGTLL